MEVLLRRSFVSKLRLLLFLATIFAVHLSCADPSCNSTERKLLADAFAHVSGFNISLLLSGSSATPSSGGGNRGGCDPGPLAPLEEIRLPAMNLSGAVSWMVLRDIPSLRVLDLSGNALCGSVPTGFWSAPALAELDLSSNRLGGPVGYVPDGARHLPPSSLRALNLSGNRFTNTVRLSAFPRLRALDLSGNDLGSMPAGIGGLAALEHLDISGCNIAGDAAPLSGLRSLSYLDASRNRMKGSFPVDFPPMAALRFLNISSNNFTGSVTADQRQKFGVSAFTDAGVSLLSEHAAAPSPSSVYQRKKGRSAEKKGRRRPGLAVILAVSSVLLLLLVFAVAATVICTLRRRRRGRTGNSQQEKAWTEMMTALASERGGKKFSPKELVVDIGAAGSALAPWVAEICASGPAATGAPVVVFEKPLMQLTFSALVAATSGFGVESQLAEGRRSGPVYRAVLPGDMDVVVKVLKKAKAVEAAEARARFQELGRLRHPNILPLLGYCIAGSEKLLLYEYMDNGDLHRWLHELPAGRTNVEDWSTDTWEHRGAAAGGVLPCSVAGDEVSAMGWATRHRIALGIARGLAFLHHAGSRPVVHGYLVASNVLLYDDFEPRIADFGAGGGDGDGCPEDDVYSYGSVLVELLTGRAGSPETVAWVRGLARGVKGEGVRCLDPRLRRQDEAEKEMVEALRVAFLCTAEAPSKRPTMRQVVGLIKDIRPPAG